MTHPLALVGNYGSPYSLKMRAVLRYRHIPFRWILRGSTWDDLPAAPVAIIPVIGFPDADGGYTDVIVDSSPQIMRLEDEFVGRSVVPGDPALAFVDALIEDFADEWLTKPMYHYRWAYDADIDKAGKVLPLSADLQLGEEAAERSYEFITTRQIGRRELVGSTEQNLPVLEESYVRVLDILSGVLAERDFVLGDRPGRADFGLYGQLSQLVKWDPTPVTIARERAPKVVHWVDRMEDLSWLPTPEGESGWLDVDRIGASLRPLLDEIGRSYTPFMLANGAALASGADEVVCEIDGREYRQGPFKYQGKCLMWMREAYTGLDETDRSRVDALLDGTGCEPLFA